jgi:ABC-type multidrug transport system ATPase subunit
MNAILGRAPYANVSGTISVNGIKNGLLNARNSVGFVPQDDICHTDLTVYQNLYYNALLRLPSNISKNEKKKHVQTIINALGLSHIQNHVVGSPSKRGISGGQKKRVNIGMELVAMPSIMFMDEPTSGLDGTATLELAQCLLKLKETGLTIVCVIHQPRYAVFKSFTHTLLLGAGGQQVYGGRTKNIMNYFYEQRFRLPLNENPADWIIDIASGFSPKYNSMDESDESIVEKFEAPIDLFKWWATWYAADCYQPEARWNSCPTISNKPETAKIEPLQHRNTPNTCMQTFLFCQRIIEQHDNTKFMVTNIALWMASFLLSSIRSGTEYRYGTLYAVLPGAVSILAMVCALQSHALIYSETLQYYRELKNGMSATGFFLAKFGYDICCTFVYACFWALACYTINPPIQRLASAYLFTYIGFAFYWASLGSLIAVIFPNSHTTGLLIMVFMPALERLWSGTEAENMGGVPIRDFVGFKQMFSFLSSGRWVSQSLYCGELLALPSHTRDFQGIPEKLYNISVVDTTIDSITDAELNVCMSNAVGTLFLLGAIFRLLTWGCFMLTKFSEGLTRRSQIYYICKRYLKVYCFDENVCSCCFEKEQEDVNTGTPFDHTNLNAIFKPSRPTGSGTDNANALETVETKISIKLCGNGSKKNQVIPSD